jgi:predicted nucleotidyltransferase
MMVYKNVYKLVPIKGTIMESKEEVILELFFNNPTKEWHFEEIVFRSNLARSKVDKWLKKFQKDKIITKVKIKNKMPYYISNYSSFTYQNKKKMFALNQFYNSGFLNHLSSLKKAKTIILFGSFARSDWYDKSDIDVFIYGECDSFKIAKFEDILKRDIQIFVAKNKNDLEKLGDGLINNIIKGNLIKGDIDFVKVSMDV